MRRAREWDCPQDSPHGATHARESETRPEAILGTGELGLQQSEQGMVRPCGLNSREMQEGGGWRMHRHSPPFHPSSVIGACTRPPLMLGCWLQCCDTLLATKLTTAARRVH